MAEFVVDPKRGRVLGKLFGQRKLRAFLVRPMSDGRVHIQGDGCCGAFDFRTRAGVWNGKGEYFPHLSPLLGAVKVEYPAEFVAACLEACPALDSESKIPGGVIRNTIQVIS